MSKPHIKLSGKKQKFNRYICVGVPKFLPMEIVAYGDTPRHAYECWARNAYPATPIRRRTKSG